ERRAHGLVPRRHARRTAPLPPRWPAPPRQRVRHDSAQGPGLGVRRGVDAAAAARQPGAVAGVGVYGNYPGAKGAARRMGRCRSGMGTMAAFDSVLWTAVEATFFRR